MNPVLLLGFSNKYLSGNRLRLSTIMSARTWDSTSIIFRDVSALKFRALETFVIIHDEGDTWWFASLRGNTYKIVLIVVISHLIYEGGCCVEGCSQRWMQY